ncbi:MAG: hypothetical protein EA397_19340 [Deltaproteobacteria bacterium]|nr:MAG: hypothetical protein EA397_19340 [Deltaproteobacteria bacterium]
MHASHLTRPGLFLVVGLTLGAPAGIATRHLASAQPEPVEASAPSSSSRSEADCEALQERARELDTQAEALAMTASLLHGQLARIGGVPIPWPDDRDPVEAEQTLASRTEELLLERYGEGAPEAQLELYCEEYPCLITFVVPHAVEEQATATERVSRASAELLGLRQFSFTFDTIEVDGELFEVEVLFGDEVLSTDALKRAEVRRERWLKREGYR